MTATKKAKRDWTASDVMSKEVICVAEDMDLRELTRMFLDRGITGAPVLNRGGDLVGVISQHDLLFYSLTRGDELVLDSDFYQSVRVDGRRLPTGFQVEDANSGRVSDVMTPVVHAVSSRTPVDRVAQLMTRKHIHRVIVTQGKKVAGIISAVDLLKVLALPPASSARTAAPAHPAAGARKRSLSRRAALKTKKAKKKVRRI
ncbi:MAG TPA: CBS domain-containing protein [Candidatus Polarisedimenticolaceae bacterium]|nr:CBS domain-containing protein [Candidatus Polarisedimenticolaceae bacterium]